MKNYRIKNYGIKENFLIRFMILAIIFNLLPACGTERGTGPEVLFNPFFEDDFYSFPFPSDFRLKEDGHPDMTGYPNPQDISLISLYAEFAEKELYGWGTNSPVYFTFTDAIDTSTLPQEPLDSLEKNSTLIFINIDDNCSSRGERVPVIWRFQEEENNYIRKNTLMLSPLWGFPLEGGCKYAVILTRGIKDNSGRKLSQNPLLRIVLNQIETTDPVIKQLQSVYSPLVRFIQSQKVIKIDDIAGATAFTIQNPVEELVRIRDYFKANYEPQIVDINYDSSGDTGDYYYFEGHYTSPNLQFGEPPYMSEGGQFVFDENGEPVIQREETLRFALTVPKNQTMPSSGYPIVMYAHGTGGDYKSFVRDGTATNLTSRGLAVISIDQPLHGPRGPEGTEVELASFNFFNPSAGRANFRQSVVDSLILTKLITHGALVIPDSITPSDTSIYFNPDRLMFMGHSHGGLTGAMFIALTDQVKSAVLSGAGGGLSLTMLERQDPNIQDMLRVITGIRDELHTFHPVIGITQMLVEVTDPINYAPYYFKKLLSFKSRNILMTEGMLDPYTPPSTAEAMATAGGIPLIEPVAHYPGSYSILNLIPLIPPVTENVIAQTGQRITSGLLQFPEDGHYAVFNNPVAKQKYGYFLYSTAYLSNTWIP
jgi:pimeloyl-ACP methyl ester carboxylesterase